MEPLYVQDLLKLPATWMQISGVGNVYNLGECDETREKGKEEHVSCKYAMRTIKGDEGLMVGLDGLFHFLFFFKVWEFSP